MANSKKCKKIIKHKSWSGGTYSTQCSNEIHMDGLCKRHYNLAQTKDIPWGKRPGYRDITEVELVSGHSIKLKTDTKNKLYRYKLGKIHWYRESATVQWTPTDLELDRTLFCIKN